MNHVGGLICFTFITLVSAEIITYKDLKNNPIAEPQEVINILKVFKETLNLKATFRPATDLPGLECLTRKRMRVKFVQISFLMIFALTHFCSPMQPNAQSLDFQT